MRSPYSRTISVRSAAAREGVGTGVAAGAGRVVTRYHVLGSGTVAGSAVATTARWRWSGPYGPAVTSSAHQTARCPSRQTRSTGCQSPGASGPSQAAARAAVASEVVIPTGAHQACAGFRART